MNFTNINLQPIAQASTEDDTYNMSTEQGLADVSDGDTQKTVSSPINDEESIICQLDPFNICYRFDDSGSMLPIKHRRPVRMFRIYK